MIAKPTSSPLLFDVAREIRAVARIWSIQKLDDGVLFRAEIGRKQLRILVERPGLNAPVNVPLEKNTPVFVVTDVNSLRNWLYQFLQQ